MHNIFSSPRARIVAAFCGAALLILPVLAFAQERVGLTVSPPTTEDRVEPGQVYTYALKVINEGDTAQTLYPSIRDVTGMTEEGRPKFSDTGEASPYALSSWVSFDKESISLLPGASDVFQVTARVPGNATPGAHIGTVAITQSAPKDITLGSGVGYQVLSILSLRVAGDVIENAQIRQFFAEHMFYGVADVKLTTTIVNEGNVFSRPKGFIDIKNMLGRKVDTLPVNDGGASVFPLSERNFITEWKPDGFHIGKYTAEMTLTVEGEQGFQSLLSTVQFWVLPTNVLIPLFVGLLVLAIVLRIMLGVYVRKQIRKATGGRVSARTRESDVASLSRLSFVVIALLVAVIVGLLLLFFVVG